MEADSICDKCGVVVPERDIDGVDTGEWADCVLCPTCVEDERIAIAERGG